MKKEDVSKLDDALFNRAIGFSKNDVVEEYSIEGDKLTLIRRKLNSKYYPPELKAIEMLMEKQNLNDEEIYKGYELEELEKEREKLLKMLNEAQEKCKDDSKGRKKK